MIKILKLKSKKKKNNLHYITPRRREQHTVISFLDGQKYLINLPQITNIINNFSKSLIVYSRCHIKKNNVLKTIQNFEHQPVPPK